MKPAILFWFYKDVEVCLDRLRLLRAYNPDTPIYGLYGGDPEQAAHFKTHLSAHLDDFHEYSEPNSREWKWLNGDLIIGRWYRDRGRHLPWDTIAVIQWDMLVFGAVSEVFSELNEGEILLGGARPIAEVSDWWNWTTYEQAGYLKFLDHVKREYAYEGAPLCAQFVVVCLPRRFLTQYIGVGEPELGFIEYRVPIYAQIFGVPFCRSARFKNWWAGEPRPRKTRWREVSLTADKYEIPFSTVRANLDRPDGARVFHPFNKVLPIAPERLARPAAGTGDEDVAAGKRALLVLGPSSAAISNAGASNAAISNAAAFGLAAALTALGVDFGNERRFVDLSIYTHEWRPTYELGWVKGLNREIAEASRGAGERLFEPARQRALAARLREAIREEWDGTRLIGIMEPGLLPLYPLWNAVLRELGYDVRVMVALDFGSGSGSDSAGRPDAAEAGTREQRARDWAGYIVNQLFFGPDSRARIIDAQRLRAAPESVIGELCHWLGFDGVNTRALARAVEDAPAGRFMNRFTDFSRPAPASGNSAEEEQGFHEFFVASCASLKGLLGPLVIAGADTGEPGD